MIVLLINIYIFFLPKSLIDKWSKVRVEPHAQQFYPEIFRLKLCELTTLLRKNHFSILPTVFFFSEPVKSIGKLQKKKKISTICGILECVNEIIFGFNNRRTLTFHQLVIRITRTCDWNWSFLGFIQFWNDRKIVASTSFKFIKSAIFDIITRVQYTKLRNFVFFYHLRSKVVQIQVDEDAHSAAPVDLFMTCIYVFNLKTLEIKITKNTTYNLFSKEFRL